MLTAELPSLIVVFARCGTSTGCVVRLTGLELADQKRSGLSRGELTPFSKRGSAVLLEDIATVEVAVLVEDPMGTDRDPRYKVVSQHDPSEATMSSIEHMSEEKSAVRVLSDKRELASKTPLSVDLRPQVDATLPRQRSD